MFICCCLDSYRYWQQTHLSDEISHSDPCFPRIQPMPSPRGTGSSLLSTSRKVLGAHWTSMNKPCSLSHTPHVFLYLSAPEMSSVNATSSASPLWSSSPDASLIWIWLSFARSYLHQVSPVMRRWWRHLVHCSSPSPSARSLENAQKSLLVSAHP